MTSPAPGYRALPPELDPRGKGSRAARRATASAGTVAHPGARRFARALSWVATLMAMIVLFGSGGAYLYINQQFSNIRRTEALCVKGCKSNPAELGATENFLLVGSDSRAGANSTGALAGNSDSTTGGSRSDTTMLVHISADRGKVTVVSFPRDLLVDMPSMIVPKTGATIGGYKAKFNAAYSVGEAAGVGPALLVTQIQNLTHLAVDHYVEIDFAGFVGMVNALGGIEICLSQNASDPVSGFVGTKGVHSIDGTTALAYVRQRDNLAGGDLGRIQRQQRFLASITRKVKSANTLLDPFKLNGFISAVTQAITLDPGTTKDDLLNLAEDLRNLDPSRVSFYSVPTSSFGSSPTLGSYLNIDIAGAHNIFQAVNDDVDPAAPPKAAPAPKASAAPTPGVASQTGPPLTVPPAQVSLTVSNGSGVAGKGAAVTAELAALGFPAALGGDATRGAGATTEIHYGSGRAESAQTLAAAVPGSVLVPDPANGAQALTLIVGTGYTAAHAVTLGAATSLAPSVAPSSAAPSAVGLVPSASAPSARPTQNFDASNTSSFCGP